MARSVHSVSVFVVLLVLVVAVLSCQSVLGAVTYESATAFVNSQSVGGGSLSSSTARGDYPVFTANTRQAVVVGSGVAGFNGSVSVAHRNATVKSMLFAQIASDAVYDKNTDVIDWYNRYATVLGNIGWNINSFSLIQYTSTLSTFEAAPTVMRLMSADLTSDEMAVLASQLQALDNDGAAYQLLQNQSTAGNSTTFQVAVASEDAFGVVSVSLLAVYFDFSADGTNFLWTVYLTANSLFKYCDVSMQLNDEVFPAAAIDKQTQDYLAHLVIDLHIAQ